MRPPREEHSPTEAQAGMAAQPKNTFRADNGFPGQHVKPPIRPPSKGPEISPAEGGTKPPVSPRRRDPSSELIKDSPPTEGCLKPPVSTPASETSSKPTAPPALLRDPEADALAFREEWFRVEHAKLDTELDLWAEMQRLLRPPPSSAPAYPTENKDTARGPVEHKLVTLPPYPVTEVHGFEERPEWSGQIPGKTVATGVATDQWQGAVSRAHRAACRLRTDEPAPAPVRILQRPARREERADAPSAPPVCSEPQRIDTVIREGAPVEAQLDQIEFDKFLAGSPAARVVELPPPQAERPDPLTPPQAAAEASATGAAVGAPPSAQAEG